MHSLIKMGFLSWSPLETNVRANMPIDRLGESAVGKRGSKTPASGPTKGQRTREEIVNRATRIAGEEGLGAISIGRLAKELRMTKSGLFVHFGSKDKLEAAVVARAADIFHGHILDPAEEEAEAGIERVWHFVISGWNSWRNESCRAAISLAGHSFCTRDRMVSFPDRSEKLPASGSRPCERQWMRHAGVAKFVAQSMPSGPPSNLTVCSSGHSGLGC